MGNQLTASQLDHAEELHSLTQKSGCPVPYEELKGLIADISHRCAWYPEAGSLSLKLWHKIGLALHQMPSASIPTLQAWHKCHHAIDSYAPQAAEEKHSLLSLTTEPPGNLIAVPQLTLPLPKLPSLQPEAAAIPNSPDFMSVQVMLEQQAQDPSGTPKELAVKIANPLMPVASVLPYSNGPRGEAKLDLEAAVKKLSEAPLPNLKRESVPSMLNLVRQVQKADPEASQAQGDSPITKKPGTVKILCNSEGGVKKDLNFPPEVTFPWPKKKQIQNTPGTKSFLPKEVSGVISLQNTRADPLHGPVLRLAKKRIKCKKKFRFKCRLKSILQYSARSIPFRAE